MATFPGSPRLLKAGLVLVDPRSAQVERVISLQYNPDALTRTLQAQGPGEGADRAEALRLKGPAIETYQLEAEIDATDQLEHPSNNNTAVRHGIQPQLATLESLVQPSASRLFANDALARAGTLEIAPMESPLALLVWGKDRIAPVRVVSLSVTEEAFDPALNPIRAKVNLGLRVLSVDDLGFDHQGGTLFMTYLQTKERLAAQATDGGLGALGIGGIG